MAWVKAWVAVSSLPQNLVVLDQDQSMVWMVSYDAEDPGQACVHHLWQMARMEKQVRVTQEKES